MAETMLRATGSSFSSSSRRSGCHCSVHGCSYNQRKLNNLLDQPCFEHENLTRRDCPCEPPFRLHKMPDDPDIKRQWLAALRRNNPPKNVYVCSFHFREKKPTIENPIPEINLGYEKKVVKRRSMLVRGSDVENCAVTEPSIRGNRKRRSSSPSGSTDVSPRKRLNTGVSVAVQLRIKSLQYEQPIAGLKKYCEQNTEKKRLRVGEMVQKDQGKKSQQPKQAASSSIADSVQARRRSEKCCVRSCNSPRCKRLDVRRTFFPFPTDDSRCKEWLKNCGQKDLMGKSSLQLRLKGYKVCSDHFEDSQFLTSAGVGGRKKLVLTAVPTIFRKKLCSRSSGPRPPRQEKSASCGGLLQMQLFSHWQPVPTGNVHHIRMDHQYAIQMPEVEIDFAEDPTLHLKAPNTMAADAAPQLPAHAETASAPQFLTAGVDIKEEPVDIKEEPMDAETEFISAKMEPPDDYIECVHSKTEPQFNTRTAPLFDFKTEPKDFLTEPLKIKTERQDFIRESQDVGPELGEIKSEPVYFEELLTNSEPVDNVAHTTDFRAVLADSECGDRGDIKVEVDDTRSDTESA